MANYSEIKNHRGVFYCYEDNLFLRFVNRNDKIYVICQNFACKSVGTISGETIVLNRKHNDHSDTKDELVRLLLVEKIRKRAADVPAESLRDI